MSQDHNQYFQGLQRYGETGAGLVVGIQFRICVLYDVVLSKPLFKSRSSIGRTNACHVIPAKMTIPSVNQEPSHHPTIKPSESPPDTIGFRTNR